MSKWSEYVDIYDVRMQRDFRRERNEALDLLESIPKAGSLDWSLDSQEWADRSNALLDRLREPEKAPLGVVVNSLSAIIMAYTPQTTDGGCRELLEQAQRALHSDPPAEKTVRERVDAYESGKKFATRVPLQILADAIDELRQK